MELAKINADPLGAGHRYRGAGEGVRVVPAVVAGGQQDDDGEHGEP